MGDTEACPLPCGFFALVTICSCGSYRGKRAHRPFVRKKVTESLTTETVRTLEGEMLLVLFLLANFSLLWEILLYFCCLVYFICHGHSPISQHPGR